MYLYLDEPCYRPECTSCMDLEVKLDKIKYWMEDLLTHLYLQTSLDVSACETSVEEICGLVGLKMPKEDLAIERKKMSPHPMNKVFDLEEWKEWNNKYLKQLVAIQ